jgi:hypothetical protein
MRPDRHWHRGLVLNREIFRECSPEHIAVGHGALARAVHSADLPSRALFGPSLSLTLRASIASGFVGVVALGALARTQR